MKHYSCIILSVLVCVLIPHRIFAIAPGSSDQSDIGLGTFDKAIWVTQVQPDGKILVGGDFTHHRNTSANGLLRLNADGTVDNTFDIGTGANGSVKSIALQADGKILVAGFFTFFNGVSKGRIVRLNADGSLDNTFTIGAGADNNIRVAIIQPDGKILLGGDFAEFNGVPFNHIVRLLANGTVDETFAIGTGANDNIATIALQGDDRILAGGSFTTFNGVSKQRLVRLAADGAIDNSFIPTGLTTYLVNAITVQGDGKILVGGLFSPYKGIVRLNVNGSVDNMFDVGAGANVNAVCAIAVQADDKILVGGEFATFGGAVLSRLARLEVNGTVDNTFTIGSGANSSVYSICIQNDGKLLVGGWFAGFNGSLSNRLVRLNQDGSTDATLNAQTLGADDHIYQIALLSDEKIILCGRFTTFNGESTNRLVRLQSDGTVDHSFVIGSGANDVVWAMRIQTDGKIVLGGDFTTFNGVPKNRLVRLHPDGSVDNSFNAGSGVNKTVNTLVVQQDGKILVGGDFTTCDGVTQHSLVRLHTNGTIDNSFDVGTGAISNYVSTGLIRTMAIQADGKILIGGNFDAYNGVSSKHYFLRLNADGSVDNTFGIGTGVNGGIVAIVVQEDGKILLAGAMSAINGVSGMRLIRLNSDGRFDNTFNCGTGPGPGLYDGIASLLVQPDGKLLVGGWFTTFNSFSSNHLIRLHTDGSVDNSFDIGTGANSCALAMTIQPDGKIIIAGAFTEYNEFARNYIVRLQGESPIVNQVNQSILTNVEIQIYPNPTSGSITIERAASVTTAELQIFSLQGQLQKTVSLNNAFKQELVLSGLSTGTYICAIIQEGRGRYACRLEVK